MLSMWRAWKLSRAVLSRRCLSSEARIDSAFVMRALLELRARHSVLVESMTGGATLNADNMREMMRLSPAAKYCSELEAIKQELADAAVLADDEEAEIASMAKEEQSRLEKRKIVLERDSLPLLLPADPDEARNAAIVEVRAGTGGMEAGLFAAELFEMYQRYAQLRGWKFETMSMSTSEIGGLKEAIAAVRGERVYSRLRWESGGHRVQRVPATERQGRTHTSTATVAVMPEVEPIEFHIDEKAVTVETMRSSGAGGQHVNTTDSAVRLTHHPTGIVVSMQDERSQIQNRKKAWSVLRARVFQVEQEKAQAERSSMRSSLIGGGNRSDRIRTYNFAQDRITDHRAEVSQFSMTNMFSGKLLDAFADAMEEKLVREQIEAMLQECKESSSTTTHL